ncbi:hypothetical protein F4604DRAFT_1684457 [Suillus subluteus]|nr:hypothetical protein F4604DRAFT_1684457 [Suillus subluteus]
MSEALDDPQTYNRKSKTEVLQSSVDVIGNDVYDKAVKKGRGHPKGVLDSTVIEPQSLPRSPIKLCSQNSSGPLSLSLHDDVIPIRPMPEVIEGETRDSVPVSKLQTVPLDTSSAFKGRNKKVAALDHRNLKLDQLSLNQTSLRESRNSSNKNIQILAENDVPALDLSNLFFKKLQSNSNKSLLRLAKSSTQEQMQLDIAESCPAMKLQSDQHVPSQSSNTFASSDDPPSFSDYTEPRNYSSDIHMVSNEESKGVKTIAQGLMDLKGVSLSLYTVPLTQMKSDDGPMKSKGLPEAGYSNRVLENFWRSIGNIQRNMKEF